MMPIWKDASYFDSPSKDVKDGPHNEDDDKDKSENDNTTKEVNTAGQHVNTASLVVNTGHFELNTVDLSLNTASSSDPHSPTDMFKFGASDTLEATHVEFFSDRDAQKVDLGNIPNSYRVPTNSHTRIHKDHPIKTMIGEVKSFIQTRRINKPTSEKELNPQAFLKLYLIHLRWKQCRKNFFNSSSNRFGYLWICLIERRPLEQNGSSEIRKMKEEEVYVTQPPGFKDPDHPDKVYKVVKALYGLHQAPKVRHETLSNYLKFNYLDVKSASTPVDLEKPLVRDEDTNDVDVHLYRSMIGSLMYLISSRPAIMFAVCACARFQVTLKTSHLLAVKRIFRYQKGKPTLGLWYPRDSPFKLVAYTNSDYARATQDRKSTTRGYQFLGNKLESWQYKKQTMVATSTTEAEYVAAASCCGQKVNPLGNSKEVKTLRYLSLVVPLKKVGDEAVHKELGDRMERAATTASSLETKQDNVIYVSLIRQFWETTSSSTYENGEIEITATIDGRVKSVTESDPTISPPPNSSPSRVPTPLYDSPLPGGNTTGNEKGRMTLNELMVLCTLLSKKVESLESDLKQIKLTYGAAYSKLIMKVKKLKNKVKSRKAKRRVRFIVSEDEDDLEDPSKQGRKIA
nr:hypothetical protein [Tanacetum cinerariifolium]